MTGATKVAYFDVTDREDEWDWINFVDDIKYDLQEKFKSLEDCSDWDGNETHIILENNFVQIGISEYCGLASVSVRIHEDIDESKQGLAERFIGAVERKLDEMSELTKVGTFSNGEAVFNRKVTA